MSLNSIVAHSTDAQCTMWTGPGIRLRKVLLADRIFEFHEDSVILYLSQAVHSALCSIKIRKGRTFVRRLRRAMGRVGKQVP